ncbi:type I restriction-modification system, M subunit [Pseudomonas aeruginosa]|nr:type I restriction-modification system, M subunit [Pseudomonas aeruginosa]
MFEHFAFDGWLEKLDKANLLYLVTQKFAAIDLHPAAISNHEMGLVFEHLIRKFAESANDTAGEFFTPRDVVRLATTLVFAPDHQALNGEGVVRTVYDCAAGTGGFLSSAIEQVAEWEPQRPPGALRPGAEPGDLRHLGGRQADPAVQHPEHQARQHPVQRPVAP